MRYYGTIIRWNEKRQFGAIREESSQREIFAPLSAFSYSDLQPQEGERVSFEIIQGRKGREEARNIRYPDRIDIPTTQRPIPADLIRRQTRAAGIMVCCICLILMGGFLGYRYWNTPSIKGTAHPQSMVNEVSKEIRAERKAWKEAVKSRSN